MDPLPEFSGVFEKVGAIGGMLFTVIWMLYAHTKAEHGKPSLRNESQSERAERHQDIIGRLDRMEKNIAKLDKCCEDLERIEYSTQDLPTIRERVAELWYGRSQQSRARTRRDE